MRRFSITLVLGFLATFFLQQQSIAQAQKPKPEDVLRKMSDYLGKLPAFACRIVGTLDIKPAHEDRMQEVMKMSVLLELPNRLALIVDEGKMGLTIVSDGKKLTQYLAVLIRYTSHEAPASFAELTEFGVTLKL